MSKRMARVLSMILTLVMFLSLPSPAFAWGGVDIGSGWDREIGDDEVRDFNEPVPEESSEEPTVAFQMEDEATGLKVDVEAPQGALPTLAELRVEQVLIEDVQDAVNEVVDGEPEILLALDISFWLDEHEIEPEEPVRVKISAPELEGQSNMTLVHIPDEEEPATVDLIPQEDLAFELGTDEIVFESSDFSVYAVIGGSDNAIKLTVNFYDGEELLSSQVLVKSQLANNPLIDPGVPTLLTTQSFEGWSLTSSYDGTTTGYSVDELNTYINTTYGNMASDATLNVYAMKFDVIYVTYHDQAGAVLRTDSAICPVGGSVSVLVKNAYVPFKSGQNFAGWTPDILVKGDVPTYASGATVYQDGSNYSFSSDVHLYPYIKIGAWLSFDNNLDQDNDATSASYTSPVFVETNTVTQEPATPERTGYTFSGWYEDKNFNTAYAFGATLAADKMVYAKWTPKQTTYRVVYWQQSANDSVNALDADKTYDYFDSEERPATTGDYVTISSTDIALGGTASSRMGYYFYYNSTNSDTGSYVVNGDGSTVLNVYYDRREITINFHGSLTSVTRDFYSSSTQYWRTTYAHYGYVGGKYVYLNLTSSNSNYPDSDGDIPKSYAVWTVASTGDTYTGTIYEFSGASTSSSSTAITLEGLYDSPLAGWPEPGSGYQWHSTSGSYTGNYGMTLPVYSFKIWGTDPKSTSYHDDIWNIWLETDSVSNPRTVYYYGQDTDGNYTIPLATYQLGYELTLTIDHTLFYGYTMHEYRYGTSGSWTNLDNVTSQKINYTSSTNNFGSNSSVTIHYKRNQWNFEFVSNNKDVKTESVFFQKNLSDLASYVPDNGPRGCYFDGWYADPGFDTPFNFDQEMPNHAVRIYAKWTLTRFRVVLDPTGGDPNVQPSDITFPGGTQATTFRLDYGDLVQGSSINNAMREGYNLMGWYLDKEYTIPFNFGQPITNEVADMSYATATDRNGVDPWRNNKEYDDDEDVDPQDGVSDHLDVRGKVVIYAKWREDPKGTIGIHVVYDAKDGTFPYEGNPTTWNDHYIYADQAEAYAQPASTPNDDSLHFLYWDIMKPTSDTDPTLVSTGKHVYPGQTWKVLVDDAVCEDLSGDGTNSLTLDPANLRVIRQGKAAGTMDTETTTVASWDFESGSIPSGWRTIDSDGDGNNWFSAYSSNYAEYAHAGFGYIRSNSYTGSGISGNALEPDNWIFSNAVTIPATGTTTLSFWIRAQDPSYPGDIVRVYVCTSQAIASATPVSADISAPAGYTEQTIDLSAYAGQTVYIAFRHYNCTDYFAVNIDDVTITNTVESEPDNYTVRFYGHNDELLSEQTVAAGGNATPPELPDSYVDGNDTYVAIVWDASYSNIHADTDIHAVYVLSSTQTPETSRYTVFLHAVYGRKDAGSVTHINWYSNKYDAYGNPIPDASTETTYVPAATLFPNGIAEKSGSKATFAYEGGNTPTYGDHGYNLIYDTVDIPESVRIPAKPYDIPGYTFKGWARIPTTENIADFNLNNEGDEIYIKWVEDNSETGGGHYVAQADDGGWVRVTYVAANEQKPYHDMYAVWEGSFQIYHSGVAGGAIETVPINFNMRTAPFNLAGRVTALNNQNRADGADKYLYGGYYLEGGFKPADYTEKTVGEGDAQKTIYIPTSTCAAYDGTNWTWTTAQTENGMAMHPKAGETYYIKEVPADKYLQPYFHYTYNKGTNEIASGWLISNLDDTNYTETGFAVLTANGEAQVVSSLTVEAQNSGSKVKLTSKRVFGASGLLSYWQVMDHYMFTEKDVFSPNHQIVQYWKTPDGLFVTSTNARTYNNLVDGSTMHSGDNKISANTTTVQSYVSPVIKNYNGETPSAEG